MSHICTHLALSHTVCRQPLEGLKLAEQRWLRDLRRAERDGMFAVLVPVMPRSHFSSCVLDFCIVFPKGAVLLVSRGSLSRLAMCAYVAVAP
jgi:hypothetical protein